MDRNVEQLTLTLDSIKNEIQTYLNHQNEHQNQKIKKRNSSWAESSFCDGTLLAQKLMQILECEEESRAKAVRRLHKKVMSNSLVVREIFRSFDVHSLLHLRQVSRLWREEATLILSCQRREKFLSVKFKSMQGKKYCHANGGTLQDFLEERAQNPQMFVYSGFIFEGGSFEGDSTLTGFFSDFGPPIQHLNLSLETLNVPKLVQILQELSPNLKSLILDPQNFSGELNPRKPEDPHFFLPKLREITLPKIRLNPVDLISEILTLTCTPNLTSVEDPNLSRVDEIVLAGKVSLVKNLTWSFYRSTHKVRNLLHFANADPELTSLTLRDFTQAVDATSRQRIFLALSYLLNLGQNTLEKVTGLEIFGQHEEAQLPRIQFPNLTELHISADDFKADKILPEGHDLSKIVPNLKSLYLKADKAKIYPFTSQSNAHKSLQKLKISISAFKLKRQHLCQWVEQLGVLYPNITHLHISIKYKGEKNIPECLKLIPRYFKNLKQLVLRFWIAKKSAYQTKAKWYLDAALTGFSKEECKKLQKEDEPNAEYQQIEALQQIRTAPSIRDLKKLTNLTFEVQFKGTAQPLWSHVAQLYAFEPMAKRQGLEVKISGF